jgi:L-ascorbate metabolism protein UlaG (beta-lactamase superfamily)
MVSRNPYYRGPKSDHFDGLRFHSPDEPPTRSLAELAWVTLVKARQRWPAVAGEAGRDVPPERVDTLRLTLIGHASMLLQVAGLNLLVDPVYATSIGPARFGGPRRAQPPGVRFEDLPPIDAILVTHNHYDHLDGPTVARLWRRFGPRVIAPLGNDAIIRRYDRAIPVETYDWGGKAALSERLAVHLEPAFHWSGRGFRDRRMALWCSFVLTGAGGGVLYHVGDTGYGDGGIFPRIREAYGPPDVALLPIGAYEPRWFMQAQHVNPEEAVRIMLDCGAGRAFGHHWGTFQLTHEPAEAPAADLARALAAHGLPPERFQALRPGQSVELPWR